MANRFLKEWTRRIHHWSTMFAGTSYYHLPQKLGRGFVPGELKGYFNDLTGKTDWKGKIDPDGFPVNTLTNGDPVYFPILLCQKALGHWDRWLLHEDQEHRKQFLKIAEWLTSRQDGGGGWDTWGTMGQPVQYRYSAMTQGEAISVMVRAHELTGDDVFEKASNQALKLMRKPVTDGGVCCYESNDVFLEEFPGPRRDTVLNGWVFALFGVHDYLLRFPNEDAKAFYDRTHASLIRSLPQFDAGFWSYYSSGTKRMASPFYHNLHLSQLEALRQITQEPSVRLTLDAWTGYANSKVKKFRALTVKGIQKIKEPCQPTIVD